MNNTTDVLIVGAGPTGLTAAIEAVRHGLSVRIIDKNNSRSVHSKALVAHARTLEIFRDMELIDDILANGQIFKALNIYNEYKQISRIVFEDLDWKDALYPFWLSIPQSETERCLEKRLNQLGVYVERQTELSAIEQQAKAVRVKLKRRDGKQETTEVCWLIGCDGARSTTRKLLNLQFQGKADDEKFILGDVKIESDLPDDEGYNILSSDGVVLIVPLPESGYRRLIFHMPSLKSDDVPDITLAYLQSLLDERTQLSITLTEMGWSSHFSVNHFVVEKHRLGRVFLAGDAAHIHSPIGGQGMNSGIQDAYNLIWKLALVHQGQAKPILLDSYETERHEVAENLIKRVSMATQIITTHHPLTQFVRNKLGNIIIQTDSAQNQLGRNVAMLDLHYSDSPVVSEDRLPGLPFQRVTRALSKKDIDFNKAPGAGYRAPSVSFQTDNAVNLYDYFYGTHHTLLIFTGQCDAISIETLTSFSKQIERRYKGLVKPILVTHQNHAISEQSVTTIYDDTGLIHQTYGAEQPCSYVIRPDLYIGYRNQQFETNTIEKYLNHLLT